MSANLVEVCLNSESILDGDFIHAKRDLVRLPSGHSAYREYFTHPGASIILPLLDNGNLVFERQYRYALGDIFIELPAGKIDEGEFPLATAKRELLEETGYWANNWTFLGVQHPSIGYSNEVMYMYIAHGLEQREVKRDADEALEVFEQSLSEAMLAIREGRISDAKTLVALFWLEKYLNDASWAKQS